MEKLVFIVLVSQNRREAQENRSYSLVGIEKDKQTKKEKRKRLKEELCVIIKEKSNTHRNGYVCTRL